MARDRLAGIVCFGAGGTLLMFVLHFMVKDVYVNNVMDWVSFFGWMSLFSFMGFLLIGLGLQLIIKSTRAETWQPNQCFGTISLQVYRKESISEPETPKPDSQESPRLHRTRKRLTQCNSWLWLNDRLQLISGIAKQVLRHVLWFFFLPCRLLCPRRNIGFCYSLWRIFPFFLPLFFAWFQRFFAEGAKLKVLGE